MSTHSRIGIVLPSHQILSIYCHHDGYLEGVGKTLRTYYALEDAAMELVLLGDLSSLANTWEETYTYGRSGEENPEHTKPVLSNDRKAFISLGNETAAEYIYLFAKGQWRWMPREGRNFRKLKNNSL